MYPNIVNVPCFTVKPPPPFPIMDPYSAPITAVPHATSFSDSTDSGPSINYDNDGDITLCIFNSPIGKMGGYVRI